MKTLNQVVLHFRRYADQKGKKVLKNNGGYTVLIKRKEEDFFVSLARCGKKDNFNKKVGRAIVEGRMECKRGVYYHRLDRDCLLNDLMYYNMKCHEKYSKEFFEKLLDRVA